MSTRMVGAAAKRHGWRVGFLALALALVAVVVGQPKASNSIVVVAVPWQGVESRFHPVTDGGSIILQASASANGDGNPVTLASGTWDPGDGAGPISINVSNSRILELTHTYTAPVGTPFTATISVTDSDGDVHTDTFKVRVEPNTLDTQANMAIDKGLWYNHKTMVLSSEVPLLSPAIPNFTYIDASSPVDQVSANFAIKRKRGNRTPGQNGLVASDDEPVIVPGMVGGPVPFEHQGYNSGEVDVISPGLQITRWSGGGLQNQGGDAIEWRFGACASAVGGNSDFRSLVNQFRTSQNWQFIPGQTICLLDLTTDTTYDLAFTAWRTYSDDPSGGVNGGSGFAYTRVQSGTLQGGDSVEWAAGTCDAPVTAFYDTHFDVLRNHFRNFGNVSDSQLDQPQCVRNLTTGQSYDFTIVSWDTGNVGFSYTREGRPGGAAPVYGTPVEVGTWTDSEQMAAVPAALQAFEVNGHRETGNPLTNPYVDDVARGLRFLQTRLHRLPIDAQGHAGTPADPSPDTNGNGYGLDTEYHEPIYVIGQLVDAFVASGTPTALATVGSETGRTYFDIVQDLMDSYSFGMDEGSGGWVYRWNEGGIDSSSSGWWGVGKHAADVWGVVTPQWVMDRNRTTGVPNLTGGNGACGYRDAGPLWSQMAETAACMIMLSADGVAHTDPQFTAAENWMAGAFMTTNSSYPGGPDPMSSIYNMYNVAKAMRTAVDSSGNGAPISLMGGTVDWYGASNGMARNLIDNQRADGKLATQNGISVNDGLSNSWGILILSPALFEQGPTAACSVDSSIVCQAGAVGGCNTTGADPYSTVNLDGSASTAGDNPIASYAWNFQDGGSSTDATTVSTSTSFSTLGTYNITLTVTDTAGHSSTVTCPVQVTEAALPPISDPGGPYEICEGKGLVLLNGSASVGRGSNIVSYEWDFTGAITFAPVDATGVATNQSAYFNALAPGTYDVGLRVTDDTVPAFVSTAYTTVTVKSKDVEECRNKPPVIDVPDNISVPATSPAGATVTFLATGSDPEDGALVPVCTPPSGSVFALGGPVTVSCTVTDSEGLSASDSFTVTVTNEPPTIVVPADISVSATSPAGAVVTFTATGSDLEDGALTPVCTPASGATFALGTTTVSCTVTDVVGASASDSFEVTVTNTPPTIDVPDNITVVATSAAGAAVSFTATGDDAEDGALTPVCTPASGATFAYGTTTVSCTVADVVGATASDTFTVTVNNTPPTVTVPADIEVVASQAGGAAVNFTATGADAQDGALTPVCEPASGTLFPYGTTTVTCTVTDLQGATDSDSFSVTVLNTPPSVTVPANISVPATSPAGATVTFLATGSDPQDGALTPTCSPASGSLFALGSTTTVTCSVADGQGLTDSDSFTVTVTNTPPTITVPDDITVDATSLAGAVVNYSATGDDAEDGALTPVCTVDSGTTFAFGTVTVDCTVTDVAGATASDSFTVTVNNTPPVVTVPADITVVANQAGGAAVDFTATALDAQEGALTPVCSPASGTLFPYGTTVVTCTATDAQGLTDSEAFSVTVENTPPSVTVPANISVTTASASGTAVSFTATGSDAQQGSLPPSCTPASGSTFPVGATTVTCTVTDNQGATATGTFTVTVVQEVTNRAPVAVNDSYTGQWNTLLTVAAPGVLGNDADPDGSPLTAIKLTNPTSGVVTLSANGKLTYMPAPNFAGVATFTYKANDGVFDSNVATVTITITSPCPSKSRDHKSRDGKSRDGNSDDGGSRDGKSRDGKSRDGRSNDGHHTFRGGDDRSHDNKSSDDRSSDDKSSDGRCRPGTPIAHSDHYATKKNSTLTVAVGNGVLKNDNKLAKTAELSILPVHGTVTLAANGSFVYVPAPGYVGNDSFFYVARSAAGVAGKIVKVSIRVRGHWDGDNCDHDKKKNKHKKGDKCDHDKDHD